MSVGVRALAVDDEPSYREGLPVALGAEGFMVDSAPDGEEALAMFEALDPDIVLPDVMLPRMSGIDVCRRIRSPAATPMIMVSARPEGIQAVVGLEVGADDGADDGEVKPCRVRELVARMRTVMRRGRAGTARSASAAATPIIGNATVDRDRHEVTIAGELERMPLKEFEAPALLMEKAGFAATRQTLIDRVWGFDCEGARAGADPSHRDGVLPALVRCDLRAARPRPRPYGPGSLTYPRGLYVGDTRPGPRPSRSGARWRCGLPEPAASSCGGWRPTLDVHIKRLRSRIERDPAEPERTVAVRGLGYKCVAP